MQLNLFSVSIKEDAADKLAEIYRQSLHNLSITIPGFQGMMGMIDDDNHEFVSLALTQRPEEIFAARESSANTREVGLLEPFFTSEPVRELHHVEVRYFPKNRPIPENGYHYARVTRGYVKPSEVSTRVDQIRDSFVHSALYQPGCTGFLLCSKQDEGIVYGLSLWDSEQSRAASEGESGYYHREMERTRPGLPREPDRRYFRVIARQLPPR